jgi:hypothetical protein
MSRNSDDFKLSTFMFKVTSYRNPKTYYYVELGKEYGRTYSLRFLTRIVNYLSFFSPKRVLINTDKDYLYLTRFLLKQPK